MTGFKHKLLKKLDMLKAPEESLEFSFYEEKCIPAFLGLLKFVHVGAIDNRRVLWYFLGRDNPSGDTMILDKMHLDGKVAVVTGASRGLGRGMALGLAEAGADILKVLAVEWAKYNIQVNAIGLGYFIPVGRWGTPEDLKGAVVFLASEASDYITGQVLFVDSGWLVG